MWDPSHNMFLSPEDFMHMPMYNESVYKECGYNILELPWS